MEVITIKQETRQKSLSLDVRFRVPTTQGNFEDFFQSRKSGQKGVFSQNQGKKIQIRELFSQTISKPF